MNKWWAISAIVILVGIAIAIFVVTKPGDEKEKLVREAVILRIEQFRTQNEEKCKKDALSIAKTKIDSILVEKTKSIYIDQDSFPEKPVKPKRPDIDSIPDTIPVIPLFKDSL